MSIDTSILVNPTPDLKFVRKEGRLILQQRFEVVRDGQGRSEWRDVPVDEAGTEELNGSPGNAITD